MDELILTCNLSSIAGIDLLQVIPIAPALRQGAEQDKNEGADRKCDVWNVEILEIHDRVAGAKRLEAAPDIEAERTRDGAAHEDEAIDQSALLSRCTAEIHGEAHDIFKHADHRGQCGKIQEQEEQSRKREYELYLELKKKYG